MGYYTYYTIEIDNTDPNIDVDIDYIMYKEVKEGNTIGHIYEDAETIKWYEHDEEILQFSKKYPNLFITLNGEGEENNDIWRKYFQNGKMQTCQAEVIFPEYDPDKME